MCVQKPAGRPGRDSGLILDAEHSFILPFGSSELELYVDPEGGGGGVQSVCLLNLLLAHPSLTMIPLVLEPP